MFCKRDSLKPGKKIEREQTYIFNGLRQFLGRSNEIRFYTCYCIIQYDFMTTH